MEPGRPNLFIVGAPRCGTSGMHAYLSRQPQVFMSRVKEPHFFGPHLFLPPRYAAPRVDSEEDYLALFAGADERAFVGEASPSYLYHGAAPDAIGRYSADPRIIVMVRHPADLMYSLHCLTAMAAFHLGDPPPLPFPGLLDAPLGGPREAMPTIARSPLGYRDLARLAAHIERYMSVFGRARVHVVVFDDLARSTEATYARVASFLGIEIGAAGRSPVQPYERMPSRQPGPGRLPQWVRSPPPVLRGAARAMLPSGLRRRAVAVAWKLDRPRAARLDPALRKRLGIEFRDDIRHLGDVIRRDLSGWYDA